MFGGLKRKINGPFSLLHGRHKTKVKQNFTTWITIYLIQKCVHFGDHNFTMNNNDITV